MADLDRAADPRTLDRGGSGSEVARLEIDQTGPGRRIARGAGAVGAVDVVGYDVVRSGVGEIEARGGLRAIAGVPPGPVQATSPVPPQEVRICE